MRFARTTTTRCRSPSHHDRSIPSADPGDISEAEMNRRLHPLWLIVAVAMVVVISPRAARPQSVTDGTSGPGQTRTLLPDGRWLIVGGMGPAGPRATASLWDPARQRLLPLADPLREPRAWHSAALLSDGTVLIAGGVGVVGILTSLERFDPSSGTFALLPGTWP